MLFVRCSSTGCIYKTYSFCRESIQQLEQAVNKGVSKNVPFPVGFESEPATNQVNQVNIC